MLREKLLPACGILFGLRVEESSHRDLAIDRDCIPTGQEHQEIWALPVARGLLGAEVHAFRHTGEFENPGDDVLTPLTTGLGTAAQGDAQALALEAQVLGGIEQLIELLLQGPLGLAALLLECGGLLGERLELFLERFQLQLGLLQE